MVDLEIAAFMTPHINRARIVLVVIGALYVFLGVRAYSAIAKLHEQVEAWAAKDKSAELAEFRSMVTLAYVTVVFAIAAGVANIVLAAIAGKKTMLAFNAAAVIFIAHTCLQIYVTSGVVFTSILWWITAIILAMGYQAARKAEKLRAGG